MKLLVDTSVWSLALRRDAPSSSEEVQLLAQALEGEGEVFVTGVILQELLQGFSGAKASESIVDRFSSLPMLVPDTHDHIQAAALRTHCRRNGVQVGSIDALIAQLAIRFELQLLTTDNDFSHLAKHAPLTLATSV